MDRLEKRTDEQIDSKLGPSGPSSMSDNGESAGQSSGGGNALAVFAPFYTEIKGWWIPRQKPHMA